MESAVLRPARPEDAPAIAELVASPADLYQVAPSESYPLGPEVVTHWLTARDGGQVLTVDEEILAYAELSPDAAQSRVWWICHVVVHPRHRRRGVGRELLRRIVRHAANELGARALWLSVFTDNPNGIRSYHRAGFRVRRSRPVEGRQLLDLALDLASAERTISIAGVAIACALAGMLTLALLPGDYRAALVDEAHYPWWMLAVAASASSCLLGLALRPILPRRKDRGVAPLGRPLLFGTVCGLLLSMIWSLSAQFVLRDWSFDLFEAINLGLQYGAGWGLVCTFLSQLMLRFHQLPATGPSLGQESFPR